MFDPFSLILIHGVCVWDQSSYLPTYCIYRYFHTDNQRQEAYQRLFSSAASDLTLLPTQNPIKAASLDFVRRRQRWAQKRLPGSQLITTSVSAPVLTNWKRVGCNKAIADFAWIVKHHLKLTVLKSSHGGGSLTLRVITSWHLEHTEVWKTSTCLWYASVTPPATANWWINLYPPQPTSATFTMNSEEANTGMEAILDRLHEKGLHLPTLVHHNFQHSTEFVITLCDVCSC